MEAETPEPKKSEKLSYQEKLKFANPISQPMAPKSMVKRLLKLIKKGHGKKNVRVGLKDVQKCIKKGEKNGLVIFAADVSPIEIMCHMPAICEEKNIPYCYVPSRDDLGHATGLNRSAVMALVTKDKEYEELYDECYQEIEALPIPS